MTASLIVNRDAALGAMWWLYQGGTFAFILANTTGAASPPGAQAALDDWFIPVDYSVSQDFDVYLTGGTATYDATVTTRAVIPQLQLVLDYDTSVTYTDILILCLPAVSPGETYPDNSVPFVGVIHEPTPVTLASTETKTYNLNLYSEWL